MNIECLCDCVIIDLVVFYYYSFVVCLVRIRIHHRWKLDLDFISFLNG
jgi:hypothetical protein